MKNILKIGTLAFLAGVILVPATANAQTWRREETANEWKNIATISGALGVLGLLNHDDTLTFAGAAGALYSVYRYDEDRKSIDRERRLRADYFGRDYFYRDGCRYERRIVNRGGQKYYQFVNVDYKVRNDRWREDQRRREEEERRRADERRREEQRRRDEQRRREEDRRRDEQRRRDEDRRREEQRRRDEDRRRDEQRRRDQDRDRHDHDHDHGRRGH